MEEDSEEEDDEDDEYDEDDDDMDSFIDDGEDVGGIDYSSYIRSLTKYDPTKWVNHHICTSCTSLMLV